VRELTVRVAEGKEGKGYAVHRKAEKRGHHCSKKGKASPFGKEGIMSKHTLLYFRIREGKRHSQGLASLVDAYCL